MAWGHLDRGLRCFSEQNYEEAIENLFTAFRLRPSYAPSFERMLARLFEEFAGKLSAVGRLPTIFPYFERAVELYSTKSTMLFKIGCILVEAGRPMTACGFFQKALKNDPSDAEIETHLNRAKCALVQRWHFRMLNDAVRNEAYETAIGEIVKPKDVVLDVGCGTGLLAAYARRAGASEVVACDSTYVMYKLCSEVVESNRLDGVSVVHRSSDELDVKANAIVTEIFDAGLFGEGALRTLLDANRRLLAPEGTIVPAKAKLFVCGVRSETLAKNYRFVRSKRNNLLSNVNFDFNVLEDVREPYDTEDLTKIRDLKYVTDVVEVLNVDFRNESELKRMLSEKGITKIVVLKVAEGGEIDSFVMWFELALSENVTITTDPRSSNRCDAWDVAVFHLRSAYSCEAGDEVSFDMRWYEGLVELTERRTTSAEDMFVPKIVIKILNDVEYVNGLIGAVGVSCIHLTQIYPFETIKVLDYTPFPLAGLLMLARGAQKLVCSANCKPLVERLSVCNKNIDLEKISFIEVFDHDEKYEMIINYFLEPQGVLRNSDIVMADCMMHRVLKEDGITIPHKIKMVAELVHADHLDTSNRVFDRNLLGPKIAQHVNAYQVSQNSIKPSFRFDEVRLSDEVTVYEQCLEAHNSIVVPAKATKDGEVNAIKVHYKVQLIPNSEELATNEADSHIDIVYHLIDPPIPVTVDEQINILSCCENNEFVKMLLDNDLG